MSEREPNQKDSRLKPTSAVLDEMHRGDIHGAFGTIRLSDVAPRRTWRRRILTLVAIGGPGLVVMVGDNGAGGVSTYAQAGQDFGYSLLWSLLLLIPVLIVNQEMVVRLGAVTGVGYARLISERFGRAWGWFSAGGIFFLNFLTISTEFMGVSLAGDYFGLKPAVIVPIAAALLIAITVSGNFRRWERAMFFFLCARTSAARRGRSSRSCSSTRRSSARRRSPSRRRTRSATCSGSVTRSTAASARPSCSTRRTRAWSSSPRPSCSSRALRSA